MVSDRTPEQVAADEALSAAVDAAQRAYDDDTEGVLTSYVVIAKRRYWNGDDGYTAISTLGMDNNVPLDEQLGLTEYASTVLRTEITQA